MWYLMRVRDIPLVNIKSERHISTKDNNPVISDFSKIQLSITLYVTSTMKIIQLSRHCFNHHVIIFLAMTGESQKNCFVQFCFGVKLHNIDLNDRFHSFCITSCTSVSLHILAGASIHCYKKYKEFCITTVSA